MLAEETSVELAAYSSKADFIAKIVEAANAVLSVFVVVVLDEPEAVKRSVMPQSRNKNILTLCTSQSSYR